MNYSLTLVIYDISYNVVFGTARVFYNRWFVIFVNLFMGVFYAVFFKKYYVDYYRYLGGDGLDVDVFTRFEGWFFCTSVRKLFWLAL